MYDQLFSLPAVRAKHLNAPFVEERTRFLRHCSELGLSRRTLQEFAPLLLVIIKRLDLANRQGVSISRDEIRRKATTSSELFISVAKRWLEFIGRLEQPSVVASRFADNINAFEDYMRREKRLSPETISGRCQVVQKILDRLAARCKSLLDVNTGEIDDALLGMVGQDGYARRTVRSCASHLRIFFRYAESCGWCRSGLAASIQSPRVFAMSSLPRGPSWNEVQRLLAMTEGNGPVDIRDRAILMLLAVYGLRSAEIRHLTLEDFDWNTETMRVLCAKTKRIRNLPLARPVGDAILRYLQMVRPKSSHRQVFLTLLPPIRPLQRYWDMVGKRLRKLGVASVNRGPHSLRHACATHLLAEGFSLKEVGDHLGHQLPNTTRIYAKVNIARLREVADLNLEGLL